MKIFIATLLQLFPLAILLSSCGAGNRIPDPTAQALDRIEKRLNEHALQISAVNEGIDELKSNQSDLEQRLEIMQSSILDMSADADKKPASTATEQKSAKKVSLSVADVAVPTSTEVGQKLMLGRAEWVWIDQNQRYLKAHIDTSVEYSMILADSLMTFERDGRKWLRAVVQVDDDEVVIEAPIQQSGRIRSFSSSASSRGPVVDLAIRLGSFTDDISFIVVERKKSAYPLALGRNVLTDVAVVDVSQKFVQKRDTKLLERERKSINSKSGQPPTSKPAPSDSSGSAK